MKHRNYWQNFDKRINLIESIAVIKLLNRINNLSDR